MHYTDQCNATISYSAKRKGTATCTSTNKSLTARTADSVESGCPLTVKIARARACVRQNVKSQRRYLLLWLQKMASVRYDESEGSHDGLVRSCTLHDGSKIAVCAATRQVKKKNRHFLHLPGSVDC